MTTLSFLRVEAAEPATADSRSMDWLALDYPYLVVDQALPDVMLEFGHNVGIAVELSEEVDGRVRRFEHEGTSGNFLDQLDREHGIDWVFDGRRLYISSEDERVDRSWSAGASVLDAVRAGLIDKSIDDKRFPISFDSSQGLLSLSAPPRYVSLAAPVIDRLTTPEATRTVNVIHGRAREGGT